MAAEDWSPPDELEEYRTIRELGRGAMGRVYLAEDRFLERLVAIKFIAATTPSEEERRRFFTEAKAVARLAHPNVVAIHRVAELGGLPFLVSEFVRGTSLADIEKPVPLATLRKIGIDLARGLAAAHRRGVLHRDIKPANAIMSEDGTTKLLDFGLAVFSRERPLRTGLGENGTPSSLEERVEGQDQSAPLVAGTPIYMAPEIWWGQKPTTRADVYSLGMLLYELATGAHPKGDILPGTLVNAILNVDTVPLRTRAPWIDESFAAIVDQCVRRDPELRFTDGDALRDAIEQSTEHAHAPPSRPEGNPYRGLFVFDSQHRHLFFGRRSEALAIVERLRSDRVVIVAGDSGTGKSSLCRAGVLPLVTEGALGSEVVVASIALGRTPLQSIADGVSTVLGEDEFALSARLRSEPPAVGRELRKSGRTALFFIDQLEELFTMSDSAEASLAAETLQRLSESCSTMRLLMTVRSDFLTRLAAIAGIGDNLSTALYLLRPLSPEHLREVVVGPAADRGFRFETDAMVDALVAEAERSVSSLPLLQFALSELWEARDERRRLIPESALAKIGGVTGALARHADDVIAGLPHPERAAARAILLALVTEEGARAQRGHAELVEAATRVSPRGDEALAALVRGRLVVAQESERTGEPVYSIAHEALVRGWDTLRGWLNHDAEGRALRQRLERAAAEWDRLGRVKDALWGDRLLAEVAGIDDLTLIERDAAFLRAARRAAMRRRWRGWIFVVGIPLVIATAAIVAHVMNVREEDRRMRDAEAMYAEAEHQQSILSRLRRDSFAAFDSAHPEVGNQLWRDVMALEPIADRLLGETGEQLERLLRDDPRREDTRNFLAKVLLERAQLAEQEGRVSQRDEMVRRLDLYGASQWSSPASISIQTTPPGVKVTLRRYLLSDGHWVETAESELGQSPVEKQSVAPGSVLLLLSAPDRVPVRLPLLVHRGEQVNIAIDVPALEQVPPGFAYIPPGTFLYGTGGGEEARAFYSSQPLHAVTTGPYLISRNETTYHDWIEFLRTLPRNQRADLMPDRRRQGFIVRLREPKEGSFEMTFGPESNPAVAMFGDPIRYAGRNRRATQDWLRMPVSGVSLEDLIAYTAWLHESGRVRGARPCTEHEWERAARGADARAYPSAERMSPDDANFDLTYDRVTTAFGPDEVGSHPGSDSPFGIHDMAGNVWEWTVFPNAQHIPVARGGSFFQSMATGRCENRAQDIPKRRDAYYGFRICASFPPP